MSHSSIYRNAIDTKEGLTKFLADIKNIHEEYAQSVVGNPSTISISTTPETVKEKFSETEQNPTKAVGYKKPKKNQLNRKKPILIMIMIMVMIYQACGSDKKITAEAVLFLQEW